MEGVSKGHYLDPSTTRGVSSASTKMPPRSLPSRSKSGIQFCRPPIGRTGAGRSKTDEAPTSPIHPRTKPQSTGASPPGAQPGVWHPRGGRSAVSRLLKLHASTGDGKIGPNPCETRPPPAERENAAGIRGGVRQRGRRTPRREEQALTPIQQALVAHPAVVLGKGSRHNRFASACPASSSGNSPSRGGEQGPMSVPFDAMIIDQARMAFEVELRAVEPATLRAEHDCMTRSDVSVGSSRLTKPVRSHAMGDSPR